MTHRSDTEKIARADPPSRISRRRFLLQVSGMVGAAGMLSACIAPISAPNSSATPPEATAAPAAESEQTINFVYGEINVTVAKSLLLLLWRKGIPRSLRRGMTFFRYVLAWNQKGQDG